MIEGRKTWCWGREQNTTHLRGFTYQPCSTNSTVAPHDPERWPVNLGQPSPLAALNLKNTSKGFLFQVDLYLICAVGQDEKWLGRGGPGGREGGGWVYFPSASLFELCATCFMNSFPQGNGNKITCLRNFRVKNELTARR